MSMYHNICCKPLSVDFGLLVLRLSVGLVFVYYGFNKVMDIDPFVQTLTKLNFPMPFLLAYLEAFVQLFAGLAILVGAYTRFAAGLLIIDMLVAIVTVHMTDLLTGNLGPALMATSMLGSTIALKSIGSGKWSLTSRECVCEPSGKKK